MGYQKMVRFSSKMLIFVLLVHTEPDEPFDTGLPDFETLLPLFKWFPVYLYQRIIFDQPDCFRPAI